MKDMLGNYDFNALYNLYPRKIGKKLGIDRCKSQIKTDIGYAKLKAAIEAYAKYCAAQGTETQFIKHFSSFMNVWVDWVPSTANKKKPLDKKPEWCRKCGNNALLVGVLNETTFAVRCSCAQGLVKSSKIPLCTDPYYKEATIYFDGHHPKEGLQGSAAEGRAEFKATLARLGHRQRIFRQVISQTGGQENNVQGSELDNDGKQRAAQAQNERVRGAVEPEVGLVKQPVDFESTPD